jgi:hypothetical protein
MMCAMATLLLALAIIFTGLYAGFMLTFQISVMPALARLSDDQFLPAMRRINEVVQRPVFTRWVVTLAERPLAVPAAGRPGGSRISAKGGSTDGWSERSRRQALTFFV